MNFVLAVILTLFGLFLEGDCLIDGLKCLPLTIKRGRVRLRSKGRIAKYTCHRGFQLLGERYSTCLRGRWDTPAPVCISEGCLVVSSDIPHGQIFDSYKGALVKFLCDPGYTLIGSPALYCNGISWNDTMPVCREITTKAQRWCDFEAEDLCGWVHDTSHDFDWRRHNFATPSGYVGTGPAFDHTLGPGLDGHYMYLEASNPRLENDTARLFSPVFPAVANNDSCFIFWYHMYGETIGALQVYVHSQQISLMFSESGNHGNQWLKGVIPLSSIDDSFQVVIEGVRGTGFVGDIAIDDVKLTEGDECTDEPITASSVLGSCKGRCHGNATTDVSACDCTLYCVGNSTCCSDFIALCGPGPTSVIQKLTSVPALNQPVLDTLTSSFTFPKKSSESVLPTSTSPYFTTSRATAAVNGHATRPTFTITLPGVRQQIENKTQMMITPTNSTLLPTSRRTIQNMGKSSASLPTVDIIPTTRSTTTIAATTTRTTTTIAAATTRSTTTIAAATTRSTTTIAATTKRNTTTTPATLTIPTEVIRTPTIRPTLVLPNKTLVPNKSTTNLKTLPTSVIRNATKSISFVTKAPINTLPSRKTNLFSTYYPKFKTTRFPKFHNISGPINWKQLPIIFHTLPPPVVFRKPEVNFETKTAVTAANLTTLPNRLVFPTKIPQFKSVVNLTKNNVLFANWNGITLTPSPTLVGKYDGKPLQSVTTTSSGGETTTAVTNLVKKQSKYRPKFKGNLQAQVRTPQKKYTAGLAAGVGLSALLLVAGVAAVRYARKRRINRRTTMDGEADVLFFTSDEILDFSLARPSSEPSVCESQR